MLLRSCRRRILTLATDANILEQPSFYSDLNAVFAHAWSILREAPIPSRSRPHAGFRTPTLASCDAEGWPQQRVMVLRDVACDGADEGAAAAAPRLRFHSDRRAPKFAQLAASPKCSVLFYDKASKLQLRASGVATLHEHGDGDATRAWRESNEASRRCYHVAEPPSAPTSLDRLRTLEEGVLAAAVGDADPPSAHFAAIVVHVQRLEFLYLAHTGNRRAASTYGDGARGPEWLIP